MMDMAEKRRVVLALIAQGPQTSIGVAGMTGISRTQVGETLLSLRRDGLIEVIGQRHRFPIYQIAFWDGAEGCELPPDPLEFVMQHRTKATPGMVPVNPDRWLSAWSGAHA